MAPSEYIREHFWVTTQPMEETEDPDHLLEVMNWIGMDRIMFSSDYPHWDFDDPFVALPPALTDEQRREDLLRQRAGALPAGVARPDQGTSAFWLLQPGSKSLDASDHNFAPLCLLSASPLGSLVRNSSPVSRSISAMSWTNLPGSYGPLL